VERRLDVPASSIGIAVAALEVVGMAEREGDFVRATVPLVGPPLVHSWAA
jgi:hypothetical protein